MKDLLVKKLHDYLIDNNPDILFDLQQTGEVASYLERKVESLGDFISDLLNANVSQYVIEETCMAELTAEYIPSRFNFILSVLGEYFEKDLEHWQMRGVAMYKVVDLLKKHTAFFDVNNFSSENEDDDGIRKLMMLELKRELADQFVQSEYLDKIDFSELE